jgi:sulfite reductase (NADPH) hemoprotein beta-component
MYTHDPAEQQRHAQDLTEFAEQTRQFLAGRLSDSAFRTLRLRRGLSMRRHGPMLRLSLPFGLVVAQQLRRLASVARRWDRGYVQFNARQQVEFHWLQLADAPTMLHELAEVQLHPVAANASGTLHIICSPLAGIAPGELLNPLPWCELLRQWSQQNPLLLGALPRRFTVAVSARQGDLASLGAHDLGLQAIEQNGQSGFAFNAAQQCLQTFVPAPALLGRLHALLHTYQQHALRDGTGRARLGTMVQPDGHGAFQEALQAQWQRLDSAALGTHDQVSEARLLRCAARFDAPRFDAPPFAKSAVRQALLSSHRASIEPRFARWLSSHVLTQCPQGHVAVRLHAAHCRAPGQLSADQLDALAGLADCHAQGRLRLARGRALMLVDVRQSALYPLWCELDLLGLAAPFAKPPGDAPDAQDLLASPRLRERVAELDYWFDLGELDLDLLLQVLGTDVPAVRQAQAVETLLHTYLTLRDSESERFVDVLERLGPKALLRPNMLPTPSTSRRLQ